MSVVTSVRRPLEEVEDLLAYIDCALRHPRPLPEGSHVYHSSIAGPPEIADLYHCLYKLYTEGSESDSFREPVNALHYRIYQYYDIITKPMSLRDVLDRIASGTYYQQVEQVEADVELIWTNAERFNGSESPITKKAHLCRAALAKLREELEGDKLPPEEEAVELVQGIIGMENPDLTEALEHLLTTELREVLTPDMSLDLNMLRVRHLRRIKALRDQFMQTTSEVRDR